MTNSLTIISCVDRVIQFHHVVCVSSNRLTGLVLSGVFLPHSTPVAEFLLPDLWMLAC